MPQLVIDREVVRKVVETVDAGLVSGVGKPIPGQMCVEAAVCFALGLPHGDNPECVAPTLRTLKIRLNDSAWSSDQARAKGLRKLAVLQLGTRDVLDEKEFMARVVEMTIRKIVPRALRSAAGMKGNKAHADRLEAAAKECETKGTKDAADAANAAAYAADAANAAAYAAKAAAYADDDSDESLAFFAADAANAAAYAAKAAAYADDDSDESLAFFAGEVAQILIEMAVPGIEWLDLLEAA